MLDFVYYPLSGVLWLWHTGFAALLGDYVNFVLLGHTYGGYPTVWIWWMQGAGDLRRIH